MSSLVLSLKNAPAQRIDCSPLTADKLEGVENIAAISAMLNSANESGVNGAQSNLWAGAAFNVNVNALMP
jgi:hypothetical protein